MHQHGGVCGRYVSSWDPMDLAALLGVDRVEATTPPDFNVAPTKPVQLVLERATDPAPARVLTVATWGLRNPHAAGPLFNVRSETVRERPAYARLLAERRCLVPAAGYYEWERRGTRRLPHFLAPPDGLLAFAGLYAADGDGLRCALLTGASSGELAWLHERAPLVVPAEHWASWLDPHDRYAGPETCLPATDLPLTATPVGDAVNNVANAGPSLVDPVEPGEPEPTLW